jgi:Fe-S-cluster containining protein
MSFHAGNSGSARQLQIVYERIGSRTAAISREQPEWPCREGCDGCCRRLAGVPELTAEEWALLRQQWVGLDAAARRAIDVGLVELARDVEAGAQHLTCPLLDREAGSCRVYAGRPAACRTYGFYVSRGVGLYCDKVRARVDAGACDEVVWGNHDVIEGDLERAFGAPRSLLRWIESEPV